jgi:hypothetical protein
MKRIIITIVVILTAVITGYFYFFSTKEVSFFKDTSVYKAVPVSTPFFTEVRSLSSVPFDSPLMRELISIEKFHTGLLFHLDTVIRDSKDISSSLRNSPFILAFCVTGRNQLAPLLIAKADGNNRKDAVRQLFNYIYPPEKFRRSEKDYGKSKIIEIDTGEGTKSVIYSFAEGLLLVSSESLLVEQSIRQLASKGIVNDRFFRDIYRSATSGGSSLFINHNYFPGFMSNIMNSDAKGRFDEFGDPVKSTTRLQSEKFRDYASWSSLDLLFGKDNLTFSGYSAADDSLNHYLSVFDGQQPVRFSADEFLPQNTSFFANIAVSDKKLFFKRLEDYFIHSGSYYMREERIKRFERGFRNNIRESFRDIVKDQIVIASATIPVNPDNKTVYFILHTENQAAAEDQMNSMLSGYASRAGYQPDSLKVEYELNSRVRVPIYKFPYPSFPGIWLGTPFFMATAEYVTFYNNCMIFCNTSQGLKEYLHSIANGTVLARDVIYQRSMQKNAGRANLNVYIDINKAFGYGPEIFSPVFLKKVTDNEENLRKFRTANWQVQYNKGSYHNLIRLVYDPELAEQPQTTWQSTIGNDIIKKPWLLTNANNPADRDIIVTDSRNNLLLLTRGGNIRWSLPLPGPVLSEIHQVDYYRNGKLQYLFNTKEKIFVIDRNGKNVADFPVTLKSPATNGINVFDYDKNRNYRYVVAGEDRKIYMYDYQGKIVSGWNFDRTGDVVTTPVQHFRISGKDYIVFKDKKHIYIQDRRGETRVPVDLSISFSDNPLMLNTDGIPKIVVSDDTGNVHYIYFDGKHEEKRTSRFSKDHFFAVDDLNGNKIPDFIFVDKNEITVLDENGKKLFSKKIGRSIACPPNIYTFSQNLKKIGVVDAGSNKIYLYNPDGKLHDGFPLHGSSEFSIGRLTDSSGALNLIVGSRGGKLYNYTLK